jgi:RimJ/RimL family protein N-acetyltransferase
VIETERLLIRAPTAAERPVMVALWSDPVNERATPDSTPEQVRAWAAGVPWGVWERDTGELVGDCSLHFDQTFQEWELSYGFRRDRWRRGYATEAASACVRYGFETMGVEKIVADVDPSNAASSRVLEKLGFECTGELEDGRLFYELSATA